MPFPSPGDLPNPGIEPGSPALQADALSSEAPGKPCVYIFTIIIWSVFIPIPKKSNDRASHKFANMSVLDKHLSYVSNKISDIKEQGQYVIVLQKYI